MTDRWPGVKFTAFAVLCVLAAVYLFAVTGNYGRDSLPLLGSKPSFSAVLPDARGMFVGDPVKLAGVTIGRVSDIGIQRGNAVVDFTVDDGVELTDSWEVGPRWRNVIGQRYLALYSALGGTPLASGTTIPLSRSREAADISRFFNQITPLLEAIDPQEQNRLLIALNQALENNTETVTELVADLGSLSGRLADEEPQIRTVLSQGAALLAEYNRRDTELSAFLTDLSLVGDTLSVRNDELLAAVSDIGEVQQRFGDLLADNQARIAASVDNAEVAARLIGEDRDDLEGVAGNLRDGLAVYMLISRAGQWFNVRAVATQAQEGGRVVLCQTEAGAACVGEVNGAGAPGQGIKANGGAAPQASSRQPALSEVFAAALGTRAGTIAGLGQIGGGR